MSNMVGIGPFITMPLLITAMGGPQAMLGWLIALLIAIPDGMVWSELGAAMPGDGGTYIYLREGFGRESFGRLMAFLFIWQFVLSGPLEIASGYIGFAEYLGYLWRGMSRHQVLLVCVAVGGINIALLYRHIGSIAKITVSLWIGVLVCMGAVILTGIFRFNPSVAFDFPEGAFNLSTGFFFGLGTATRIGMYNYLGYYGVCYLAAEVKDPGRVIPRSIMISIVGVALLYLAMNLSVIGVVHWRDLAPASTKPGTEFIVSTVVAKVFGTRVAAVFTALVLWTAFASVFALLLGYSRIPYAAAEDGYFFKVFSRLHPKKRFPHISLLAIGLPSILCSFLSLSTVIDALIATRIVIQFAGQILAVFLLRKRRPEMSRPYRIWLYPVPNAVALVGWIFILSTTEVRVLIFSTATVLSGLLFFLVWSWWKIRWPFSGVVAASSKLDADH
jgi:APA family basic amino acid/polyamine antiporter